MEKELNRLDFPYKLDKDTFNVTIPRRRLDIDPNKNDIAFGKHSAIMPEEIPYRCIRLFSCEGDVVLDPFTGSGTTLKVAKSLNRHFVGYELYENYKSLIERKLNLVDNEKQRDLFS